MDEMIDNPTQTEEATHQCYYAYCRRKRPASQMRRFAVMTYIDVPGRDNTYRTVRRYSNEWFCADSTCALAHTQANSD